MFKQSAIAEAANGLFSRVGACPLPPGRLQTRSEKDLAAR